MSASKRKRSTPRKVLQNDIQDQTSDISEKIKHQRESFEKEFRKTIAARYPNLDAYEAVTAHNLNVTSLKATQIAKQILVLNLQLKNKKIQKHEIVEENWAIIEAKYGKSVTLRRLLDSDPLNKTVHTMQDKKKQEKNLKQEMQTLEYEITKQMNELSENQHRLLKHLQLLNKRTEMIHN